MERPDSVQEDTQTYSRRNVLRKAAYTAPVVIAIAAAPKVALGHSGPGRGRGGKKKGRGGPGRGRR
jgi:hypothetical protein